jgi:hypothetical protein
MRIQNICGVILAAMFSAGVAAQSAEPVPMHQHPVAGEAMQADAVKPTEQLITLPPDPRERVRFPTEVRHHTLANMRDHLMALQEIDEALGRADYQKAADVAEQRLGMSSMRLHGAHEMAQFMPAGMQAIGSEMHHAASRFAIEAQNAGATGDARPALAALGQVMRQCVACHGAYRVQ